MIRPEVLKGASLLDEKIPYWYYRVNSIARLEGQGVLDQLCGSHEEGLKAIGLEWNESIAHGFSLEGTDPDGVRSEILDNEWESVISWRKNP